MKRFVLMLSATLSMLCIGNYTYAQSGKVNGTVTDENKIPMTGATVVVPGTQKYAVTDIDGKFSIDAAQGETLRVSYLGYDDSDITVTSSKVYDVSLTPSAATMLDETVVIGYGTSTKKEITGSVTSLKAEDFDKGRLQMLPLSCKEKLRVFQSPIRMVQTLMPQWKYFFEGPTHFPPVKGRLSLLTVSVEPISEA